VARNPEEVVDRLVADRQLAPFLEAERLVERDRALRIGDAVAGVDELSDGASLYAPGTEAVSPVRKGRWVPSEPSQWYKCSCLAR
jgi:hypothetical protein